MHLLDARGPEERWELLSALAHDGSALGHGESDCRIETWRLMVPQNRRMVPPILGLTQERLLPVGDLNVAGPG